MAADLIKRDTVNTVAGFIQNDLTTTTGTDASFFEGRNGIGTFTRTWGTAGLGITTWDNGTYTWRLRVTTANPNINIITIWLFRVSNDGTTSKASKSSGTISVSCSTTGVKSGTIVWNDGTQNPGNAASDDRFAIEFTFENVAMGNNQVGIGVNLGSTNDEISTPLTLATLYNKPISEPSVSVSETLDPTFYLTKNISESSVSVSDTLDDTETYIKPVSESSISVSDAIEGTKIPAAPANAVYSVHFVEFPEEITDSVFVPPSVAVEQVSTTKTHKYDVIAKVTTTKTHKYDVIALVTSIKTHVFSVLQQIAQSTTHKYNVIAKITAVKTHVFSVLTAITRTRTHKYDVLQQIIRTLTHKYDIASSIIEVTTTKTHKYNVISAFTQVTTTKTHKYDVIAKVTKTKTHVFSVIQQILASTTHKYNVIQQIILSKIHKFNLVSATITAKTHIYSVIASVLHTKTHKYDVAGRITTTKTHKFDIVTKITQIKTYLYNILIAVSPATTKTHRYAILQLAASTRTHKFNIIGRIYKTKTHRYQMGGKVLSTKTHKYEVGLGALLKELGGSTNAYVRFPERVQIIDIIADLNNLAIANVEIAIARPPSSIATATVAIAEYYVPAGSKLLTASVHKPRHRIASRLITPQVIDTIENLAIAPYIGIEVLESTPQSRFQLLASILLQKPLTPNFLTQSHTQIKQDEHTKIRIASATMLQQTQETIIGSRAQLEIQAFPRPILAPEIMTRQKAKILKTLVNLLSSDELFQ